MRISRVRAFLVYAHDTPPRVQHFSAFHFYSSYMSLIKEFFNIVFLNLRIGGFMYMRSVVILIV